ncbi:MAG: hypothetical protein H8Z69_04515 [Nanohaloarchaea archaeon]|nr:hypothetical protein [Candidatus Nanohaloarchaea archaeon]
MIREYAPIGLIPAAWLMTLATLVYPKISTYWIEHMHYFMIAFLGGFTLFSWRQMDSDPVLKIWRNVIAGGLFFTLIGALSFMNLPYTGLMSWASIGYWFLAPSTALYLSAEEMDRYSQLYNQLSFVSVAGVAVFVTGILLSSDPAIAVGIVGIAAAQTVSIVAAADLDS